MKQYKGYYIDKTGEEGFESKEAIDEFIKWQYIREFNILHHLFATVDSTVEMAIACDEIAQKLHNEYGFSWEELEAMEIEAYKAA